MEAALKSFLSVINVNTGISHPSDKARAIETFKLLQKHREPYDLAEVRAWLVQHGLDPEDADAVVKIAAKPSAARARSSFGAMDDSFIEDWREEAGK